MYPTHSPSSLRVLRLLVWLAVGTAATLAPAADESRFSRSLPESRAVAAGLPRLDSDQVAVLDALVRRDVAQAELVHKTPRAARFSERLSADERRNAGLPLLNDGEIAALDAAVQDLIRPPVSLSAAAGPTRSPLSLSAVKLRRDPEIHGELSFTVGVGSHGYSEIGGGLLLTYDDPDRDFSLAVGYYESHVKGDWLYRDYRDGFPTQDRDRLRDRLLAK